MNETAQGRPDAVHVTAPVALIAGGGALPFAVADSLKNRGLDPVIFALRGFCDPQKVGAYRHHWVALGKFGEAMSLMRKEGCRDVTFIGTLVRPALSELRFDWLTLRLIPEIIAGLRGGDDHLLTSTARIFETRGFRLLGMRELAPDLLMPEGILTATKPGRADLADIDKGREVLRSMSPHDIGQGTIVIDGHVVSVEDIGGTDSLLMRIRELRESGRLRAKPGSGVLVKAPKQGQDLRFDLPALGPKTIDGVIAAGLGGLAVIAGHSIVADLQAMVETADKARIFIVGLSP
ncbi:MAG: UDP-2,3-diacylglucosamine diphosphatase LpxI [Xanthobacteraceae bacterium]|nr:UDP-2,3-diacylglucosamine diphosphatase LpxI [Xanthobacteraceae bacterium]